MTLCSSQVMTFPQSRASVQDQLLVQGLDGVDVDDPGADALGGQVLGGDAGLVHLQAGGDDGDVLALGDRFALADLKVVVVGVVENGHGQPAQPQVDRAVHLEGGADGRPCLDVVGGADDGHAGQRAHEGKVLAALVGRAVLAHRNAPVGRADLDVEAGVSDGVRICS